MPGTLPLQDRFTIDRNLMSTAFIATWQVIEAKDEPGVSFSQLMEDNLSRGHHLLAVEIEPAYTRIDRDQHVKSFWRSFSIKLLSSATPGIDPAVILVVKVERAVDCHFAPERWSGRADVKQVAVRPIYNL